MISRYTQSGKDEIRKLTEAYDVIVNSDDLALQPELHLEIIRRRDQLLKQTFREVLVREGLFKRPYGSRGSLEHAIRDFFLDIMDTSARAAEVLAEASAKRRIWKGDATITEELALHTGLSTWTTDADSGSESEPESSSSTSSPSVVYESPSELDDIPITYFQLS